ncbi:P-loop containing nucleoside triphosphate hydrolase protein, partial [Gorgonomyces haynaldii]
VLLLGSTHVGKSTLIKTFVQKQPMIDHRQRLFLQKYEPSIEQSTSFQYFTDQGTLTLNLIEIGGNPHFYSLLKPAIESADCIVLVYDVCDLQSFKAIREYYRYISKYKPDASLMLLGNMVDTVSERGRQVTLQDGQKLADMLKISFYETSCRAPKNMIIAFNTLLDD